MPHTMTQQESLEWQLLEWLPSSLTFAKQDLITSSNLELWARRWSAETRKQETKITRRRAEGRSALHSHFRLWEVGRGTCCKCLPGVRAEKPLWDLVNSRYPQAQGPTCGFLWSIQHLRETPAQLLDIFWENQMRNSKSMDAYFMCQLGKLWIQVIVSSHSSTSIFQLEPEFSILWSLVFFYF
jgi:hypothetical protein